MTMWLLQVDPIHRLTHDVRLPGLVLALGIVLVDLVMSRILVTELRRSIKLSASLAWLYLALSAVRCFVSSTSDLESILRITATVSLSISTAHCAFIVVIDYMIGRNGKKPIGALIRSIVLVISFLGAALIGLRAGGVTTVGVLASGAVIVGGAGAAVSQLVRQLGAGALLQYTKPFEVGDVVQILSTNQPDISRRGTVVHVHWSTTLLRGPDGVDFLVPNHDFVTNSLFNYGHGDQTFRRDINFHASYETPPHVVTQSVLNTIRTMPGVEHEPAPQVVVREFQDSSISYQLRYWTRAPQLLDDLDAEARMRIWYAFSRNGLRFPFPIRQLQLLSDPNAAKQIETSKDNLKKCSLFNFVPDEELTKLVQQSREEYYAAGEIIVAMGDKGRAMYIVLEGDVSIISSPSTNEILRLTEGDFFGEVSLLTGGPRTATVVAATVVRTLVVDESVFRTLIVQFPTIAEILSDGLIRRQTQLNSAETQQNPNSTERQNMQKAIVQKIKSLFGL